VRIDACGSVDELNAVLGLARAEGPSDEIDSLLADVQNDLFAIGAELATPDADARSRQRVQDRRVAALESAIDRHAERLAPLTEFILPGGVSRAAALHCARAVCRRAERRVVRLARRQEEQVPGALLRYLNRLSDLLFVLARAVNAAAGRDEVAWRKQPPP
jgi:cob(I)alamin adenosyltransferase